MASVTVDQSEAGDLVLVKIQNDTPLSSTAIAAILLNVSQKISEGEINAEQSINSDSDSVEPDRS